MKNYTKLSQINTTNTWNLQIHHGETMKKLWNGTKLAHRLSKIWKTWQSYGTLTQKLLKLTKSSLWNAENLWNGTNLAHRLSKIGKNLAKSSRWNWTRLAHMDTRKHLGTHAITCGYTRTHANTRGHIGCMQTHTDTTRHAHPTYVSCLGGERDLCNLHIGQGRDATLQTTLFFTGGSVMWPIYCTTHMRTLHGERDLRNLPTGHDIWLLTLTCDLWLWPLSFRRGNRAAALRRPYIR